jgi:FixJ family two-component response regulator
VPTSHTQPLRTAIIVDDDASIREALSGLFQTIGLHAVAFDSVKSYLDAEPPRRPACLILDVRLPDRSGLDLQAELARSKAAIPVIILTGNADVPMSVQALKAGAVDFLTKPVRDQDLIEAVHRAIQVDVEHQERLSRTRHLQEAYATLTKRERDIFTFVITGQPNKQIAAACGLSEATVKLHRGNVMHKMQARTLVNLVHYAAEIGVDPAP